jgi:hypothetical protein
MDLFSHHVNIRVNVHTVTHVHIAARIRVAKQLKYKCSEEIKQGLEILDLNSQNQARSNSKNCKNKLFLGAKSKILQKNIYISIT